jgi:hypothetical protein
MKLPVKDIAHVLTSDIDTTQAVDIARVDALIFSCVAASKDALMSAPPSGFSPYERDHLTHVLEGLRQSHLGIRRLLNGERGGWAVAALAIARLQMETLYTFCFLLEAPEHLRLFLKSGWKKKYVRHLLEREERKLLPRFNKFLQTDSIVRLENLRVMSFVTEEEKRTIEIDELGPPFGPVPSLVRISSFPTPMGVLKSLTNPSQLRMLKRLYPEYQFLCSLLMGTRSLLYSKRFQTNARYSNT